MGLRSNIHIWGFLSFFLFHIFWFLFVFIFHDINESESFKAEHLKCTANRWMVWFHLKSGSQLVNCSDAEQSLSELFITSCSVCKQTKVSDSGDVSSFPISAKCFTVLAQLLFLRSKTGFPVSETSSTCQGFLFSERRVVNIRQTVTQNCFCLLRQLQMIITKHDFLK